MQNVIETFSLTKVFSDWWGRNKVYAVEDLNLQIRANEVFGLLGPNGSGKTTTLKMLLGLLYPTRGKTVVLGGDSTDPKISARIGFMPEESYLYKYLNPRETLNFYGRLFGLPSKVRKMRIEALLDMVGLKAVANRAVGSFSKGMARRISLAQALINDPDLLILDEPTTGLDPIGTRQIKDLILQLAKRGKTVLLCSHLLADVEDVCDRIAILYGGKVQSEGKVRELLQQTDKKQITTGHISDSTIEKIKRIVQEDNADCVVSSPMDKLETFFIKTVAAAQQQTQSVSGAVSTTEIGEFLTFKTKENILDKLVSASVSPQVNAEKLTIDEVTPVETTEVQPDEQLLKELSKPAKPAKTEPVVKTKPVEPQTEQPREVKKSILEQLTDSSQRTSHSEEGEQSGNHQGDSSDA
jgi:ABC-2 type transport system ATP-binding protein